jgi:hypothetical protein
VPPRAVLLIGWAIFLAYGYPGYMSTDSCDQLVQARAGVYNDWHPALMAREWRLIEVFVTGPFGMLLAQSALFLWGVYFLLRRITPSARAAAAFAVVTLLFPPVMTTMAVIWKDSQMAGYLAMGAALVLSPRPRLRRLGYVLLFVACGMRYNAAAAVLPLLLHATWSWTRPRWQRIGAAVLITIGLFVSSGQVNSWLTDEHQYPWHSSLALFDLAGTIRDAGPASDAEIEDELDGTPLAIHQDLYAKITAAYDPRTWWYLSHGDNRIFDPPTTDAQREAIERAWRGLVLDHPGAYFRHRRRVFYNLLGLKKEDRQLWSSVYHNIAEDPARLPGLQHDASPSALQRWLYARFDRYQNGRWFRPYIYFFATILALLVCAYQRRGYELALLCSGLAYELSYLVVAPSPDNRYSHWMIACFTIAGSVSLLHARRARLTSGPGS